MLHLVEVWMREGTRGMLKMAENGGSGAGRHYAPKLQDQDKG